MPKKKYIVALTDCERAELEQLTKKGKITLFWNFRKTFAKPGLCRLYVISDRRLFSILPAGEYWTFLTLGEVG